MEHLQYNDAACFFSHTNIHMQQQRLLDNSPTNQLAVSQVADCIVLNSRHAD